MVVFQPGTGYGLGIMSRSKRNRDEHLRRLAGLAESERLGEVAAEQRKELGDCWDCAWEHEKSYVRLGERLMVILACRARLGLRVEFDGGGKRLVPPGDGSDGAVKNWETHPVMVPLPLRCKFWVKRKKLVVIEGGGGGGVDVRGAATGRQTES